MDFDFVKVEDAQWAIPLLEANGYMSCEFAFTNIYMWKRVNNTLIARHDDFIVVKGDYFNKNIHYQFPCGTGELKNVMDVILEDALDGPKPPIITTIPNEGKKALEALYPGYFKFVNPRDFSDYIYHSTDLADLPGRKYQKKRNHCSRFERTYPDWQFKEIDADALDSICAFNDLWCNQYDNREDVGIQDEQIAIQQACRHYEELHLKGGYITVGGEVVAFSFGTPLGNEFVTHVEKALYDVHGAYAMINREMARAFGKDFKYINRENDVGVEGLREAKLSYHPAFLLDKWHAEPVCWPPKG